MKRRARLRVSEVPCECGATVTVRWAPLVYVRLLKGQDEAAVAVVVDCQACGSEVAVRAGDARRAA